VRAVIITRPGGPEVLEEHTRPAPDPGVQQVRVRVHASALNRADLIQRRGGYPAPPGAPADIPGLEYAGTIDALGPGAARWSVGDRVMGIVGGGGHAEYLCVHEREAIAVPAGLSWEQAAAIPEVFLTAYDALFRQLHLLVGERLLIHAVGSGVGTAALQLARVAGATVFGTSRSISKLASARDLGLEMGFDSSRDDWPARIDDALGVTSISAILDLVGGGYLAGNLRVLTPRGRIVVVGLTAGARAEIDLGMVLRKRLHIMGTVLRARPLEEKIDLARDFSEHVIPLLASGRVQPVIDRIYSFADIRAAHALMESDQTFGKLVLRWE
jgi:putative PIG3 family NAD(P)H quinone oxidoreductase